MVEQLEDMKHEAVEETIKHIDKGPTYIGCFNPASRCYFYPIPRSCPNEQYHSVAAWLCSRFFNTLLYFSHLTTHRALQCWKKNGTRRQDKCPQLWSCSIIYNFFTYSKTPRKQTLTNKISCIINTYLIINRNDLRSYGATDTPWNFSLRFKKISVKQISLSRKAMLIVWLVNRDRKGNQQNFE